MASESGTSCPSQRVTAIGMANSKEHRKFRPGEIDHEIDFQSFSVIEEPTRDTQTLELCERIYRLYVENPSPLPIPDSSFCDLPRWVFLDYLVRSKNALLFGSNNPNLTRLEPVVLSQNLIGWDAPRHLAFTSCAEAIYRAILDSRHLVRRQFSEQCTIVSPFGDPPSAAKRFYFGLDHRIVSEAPWRNGTVYIFRRIDFADDFQSRPFLSSQPIRPVACLQVSPSDWPLLDKVHGVDHTSQKNRQWETLSGYPWIADTEIHPGLWKRPLATAIRDHIDANYGEPLGLEKLGKIIGSSPFATLRFFRSVYGQSPHEYQTALRISKAKELLRQGKPIARVAVDTGFYDQTHLNRNFRRLMGITPGQYLRLQDRPILSS